MRIRTRLFVGTAALVLALVGIGWWLQIRQLNTLQGELAGLAASIGQGMVVGEAAAGGSLDEKHPKAEADQLLHVAAGETPVAPPAAHATAVAGNVETEVAKNFIVRTDNGVRKGEETIVWTQREGATSAEKIGDGIVVLHRVLVPRAVKIARAPRAGDATEGQTGQGPESVEVKREHELIGAATSGTVFTGQVELKVVAEPGGSHKTLIVRSQPGHEVRVPVDLSPTIKLVHDTLRTGLLASGALLALGMLGAAVMAHRVTRPLRVLAQGVDAVGRGSVGTQVPVSEAGEVGELQQSFNRMSAQLASLEQERERWQAREHLAELGDLARGLGHTLRNPLNTLGLAVDEMASLAGSDGARLAGVARGQIRRIDRWLVSFLSLGVGRAAEPEDTLLSEVVAEVVLELTQSGRAIQWRPAEQELRVRAVPGALRAAFASLLENAVEASPTDSPVEVTLASEGDCAIVRVLDRGAGIPEEVRGKLYSPHATTKSGGAGLGLYLAKQIIEVGHGGTLELLDRSGGGTEAIVSLPLEQAAR